MSDPSKRHLSLQELPELRRKTDLVAKLLTEQLGAHLETLRPLFAPERILGRHAGGKIDVAGADLALAELQQNYRAFTAKPYNLSATFETTWLPLVGQALDARPWDYTLTLGGRAITITSPVKWVLNYRSSVGFAQLRTAIAEQEQIRSDEIRQAVLNALVLQLVLRRHPGISSLFRDLRFALAIESVPEMPGYPLITLTSCLPSFRPPDELILAATAFSGIPSFIELTDVEAIRQPRDTLREQLEAAFA